MPVPHRRGWCDVLLWVCSNTQEVHREVRKGVMSQGVALLVVVARPVVGPHSHQEAICFAIGQESFPVGLQPQVWCDAGVAEVRGCRLVWGSLLLAQNVMGLWFDLSGNSDSQGDWGVPVWVLVASVLVYPP